MGVCKHLAHDPFYTPDLFVISIAKRNDHTRYFPHIEPQFHRLHQPPPFRTHNQFPPFSYFSPIHPRLSWPLLACICIVYQTLSQIIPKIYTLTPIRTSLNTLLINQYSLQINLNPMSFQKFHQQTTPTIVSQHKIPPPNPHNVHHPSLTHLSLKIFLQTVTTPPSPYRPHPTYSYR